MMFDWNDQDQVGDTIWGKLNEEDHIVPYPTDTKEEPLLAFGDCNKNQRHADANTVVWSTGQTSGAKNEFLGCNLENSSSLDAKEEPTGPRLDMDAWPDLPSLNGELSTGELSLNQSYSSLAGHTVHLDGESGLFGNAPNDKENDSFLDREWDNIGDFDDLDRLLRNDSIFGHDTVTNVDDFLSLSADMNGSAIQPIPMPEIPLSRDQPSDQGYSSIPLVEHCGGKRKAEDKILLKIESKLLIKHQIATNSLKSMLPSDEISGGTWYQEGALDVAFIEILRQQCMKYIQILKVATRDEIRDKIRALPVFKADITLRQISEIVELMVVDKEIEKVRSTGIGDFSHVPAGKECYRILKGGKGPKGGLFSWIPCGVCPRISECTPDGLISPVNCVYYNKWLDIDF